MVPLFGSHGELRGCLFIAAELGLGSDLQLSWCGVPIQSLLPREPRGSCSLVDALARLSPCGNFVTALVLCGQ
jgi:hypothetical protein